MQKYRIYIISTVKILSKIKLQFHKNKNILQNAIFYHLFTIEFILNYI